MPNPERMHVAFFSPTWGTGTHPNGVVTYVHGMREELLRRGHRVSIFTPWSGSPAPDVHVVRPSSGARLRSWLLSRGRASEPAIFSWGDVIAHAVRRAHRT